MNTTPAGPLNHPLAALLVLRWIARILSLLVLGLVLMFAFGEKLDLARFTPRELMLSLFFPLGLCLGLALAWRWEGWGGALAVASMIAFYLADRLMSGSFPRGVFFPSLAVPGSLFLLCWWWARTVNWKK